MNEGLEFVIRAGAIEAGATAVMDVWVWILARVLRIPSLDFAMVGRWIGHFAEGRFAHDSIAKVQPVRHERVIGWCAHYGIGIIFAAGLLALCGPDWARHPTIVPPLAFGLLKVAAPFLVMQPGMGAGIAARRTPNPNLARLRSIITHTVFGVGLYGSARLLALLLRP